MRPLFKIAQEIRQDWKNLSPHAQPYVQAMILLNGPKDVYGADDAQSVILYFLSNASGWRGNKAREIKAELKSMLA
jgi:hypothetical protein